MGKLDGPDEIDEARWEKLMDEPVKKAAHHERCRCPACVAYVHHDATGIQVNRATDEVTFPCGRAVYSPDEERTHHTGAYDSRRVDCTGCRRAIERQRAEGERVLAERLANGDLP